MQGGSLPPQPSPKPTPTPAQIQQDVAGFNAALASGQITQAQYNEVMAYENTLAMQAGAPSVFTPTTQYPSSPQTAQPSPSTPASLIPTVQAAPVTITPAAQPSQNLLGSFPPQYVSRPESVQPTPTTPPVILPKGATLLDVTPAPAGQGYQISYVTPPPLASYPAVYTKPISVQPAPVVPPNIWTQPNPGTAPLKVAPLSTTQAPPLTVLDLLGGTFARINSPVGALLQWDVGVAGEIANQITGVKNVVGNLAGQKPAPMPFTPSSQIEQYGGYGAQVTEIVGLAVVGPEILPISAPAILGAGILNVGIGQGINYLLTGKVGSPSEMLSQALVGEGFAITGAGILKGLSTVAESSTPAVARIGQLLGGTAPGRIGTFSGLGAAVGYVSTGTPLGAAEGAAFGALFSGIGEVAARVGPKLPTLKLGSVDVPLEGNIEGIESVTWKGLYISRGSEATPLLGRISEVPEGSLISPDYVPESNIAARITQDVMGRAGYSPETLAAVQNVRGVMASTQFVQSKFVEDILPQKTVTLSAEGVSALKEGMIANKAEIAEIYGSFGNYPQISHEFEVTYEGKSGLATPHDVDIQLRTTKS